MNKRIKSPNGQFAAKVTPEQIANALARYTTTDESTASIAADLGVGDKHLLARLRGMPGYAEAAEQRRGGAHLPITRPKIEIAGHWVPATAISETWPIELIARVITAWCGGMHINDMVNKFHRSRGQIIGKVHRLLLPPRGSPIRRRMTAAERATRRENIRAGVERRRADMKRVGPGEAQRPVFVAPPPPPAPPKYGRITDCCWPLGEPGTRGFRYCDDPSEPGKPYCAEHCGVAYIKRESLPDLGGQNGADTTQLLAEFAPPVGQFNRLSPAMQQKLDRDGPIA